MAGLLRIRQQFTIFLFLQIFLIKLFAPDPNSLSPGRLPEIAGNNSRRYFKQIWPWRFFRKKTNFTKNKKIWHYLAVAKGLLAAFVPEVPVIEIRGEEASLPKGFYHLSLMTLENNFVTKILTEWHPFHENGDALNVHIAKYFWLNDGKILQLVRNDCGKLGYQEVSEENVFVDSEFWEVLIPFRCKSKFLYLDVVSENIYVSGDVLEKIILSFNLTNLEVDMRRFSLHNVAEF